MAANEVKIVLKAVDGGFEGTINQAVTQTDKLAESVKRVGHYGTALIGINFAAGWARQAGQVMDAFSGQSSRLRLASDSAADAAVAYSELFDIAQRSRVSFVDLGQTYAQMARSTKELGISSADLRGVTETIAKSMTISGGSAESMKAALLQLSQGMASGTLRGEELNSVMEQTPRLAQAIAAGMGVSIGELRKLGEEGKLTTESVFSALKSQAEAIDGEFARVKPTIGQAFQTLSDTAGDAIHKLDEAGNVTGRVVGAIDGLAGAIRYATDSAEKAGALIKLLELLLAVGTARGAMALLGRLGMGAGAIAGGPATIAAGAGLWAMTTDMSGYGKSMKRPNMSLQQLLAEQGIEPFEFAPDMLDIESALIGRRDFTTPKELLTKAQKHDAARGELIEVFKKAVKAQKLTEADPAYISLAKQLSDALKEADQSFFKEKVKKTDAPDSMNADVWKMINRNLRASEAEERAKRSMGTTVDSLIDAYQRQNAQSDERRLTVEQRELAAALRQVEEQADRAREALSQKAATLKTEDVVAMEAFKQSVIDVTNAEEAQMKRVREVHDQKMRLNADWKSGMDEAIKQYAASSKNAAQTAQEAFTRAFSSMEDAIVQFATTGKISFSGLANSIISDMIRMQVRAAMAPATAGLGDWVMGLFGSNAGAGASVANTPSTYSTPIASSSVQMFPLQHSGGIVGSGEGSGYRAASGGLFVGAPRFHTGGIAGNEVPTILQKGEGVFTQGQMKALGASLGGAGPSVVVNIQNNGNNTQATATSHTDAGGKTIIDVLIEQVKGAIASDIGSGGMVAGAMEGQYGLNRAAGAWR